MPKRSSKAPKSDPINAAAAVAKATGAKDASPMPLAIEKAWEAWSASIRNVDERGKPLLRAAFEAGVDAVRAAYPTASDIGRKGGIKGGKARLTTMTAEERSRRARDAARRRWAGKSAS